MPSTPEAKECDNCTPGGQYGVTLKACTRFKVTHHAMLWAGVSDRALEGGPQKVLRDPRRAAGGAHVECRQGLSEGGCCPRYLNRRPACPLWAQHCVFAKATQKRE